MFDIHTLIQRIRSRQWPAARTDLKGRFLADLVEAYERKHVPIDYPSPIAAIEFRMDQVGLTPRDLVPFIGSRAKVSEVLSGKRPITMPMARALHEHLGIPAEALLQEPGAAADQPEDDIQWRRFPLREMAKRKWIPSVPDLAQRAEHLVRDLIDRAGGWQVARAALYGKNDHLRTNAKTDPYALQAWCWQVLATVLVACDGPAAAPVHRRVLPHGSPHGRCRPACSATRAVPWRRCHR